MEMSDLRTKLLEILEYANWPSQQEVDEAKEADLELITIHQAADAALEVLQAEQREYKKKSISAIRAVVEKTDMEGLVAENAELRAQLAKTANQLTQHVQGLVIWTKVEDGLPDEEFTDDGSASEPVLLQHKDEDGDLEIDKAFTQGGYWFFVNTGLLVSKGYTPIQWAPLPQPTDQ